MKLTRASLALALFASLMLTAQTTTNTIRNSWKKLIEYGWDCPTIQYIEENLPKMEEEPFDGLIFSLSSGINILSLDNLDEEKYKEDVKSCANVQWNKFTDNFILTIVASEQDWFNDEHWAHIENKAKLFARAARLARCKGICFDQEPYGTNPWLYVGAAHQSTKTFEEYEAMARKRGAQFMRALESEFPGLTLLTFFQLSYYTPMLKPMDPEQRAKILQEQHYALLPAFLNGMLDAASPFVEIIDGNEGAYGYSGKNEYFEKYHEIHNQGDYLIDPANITKYRNQVKVGQALYMDMYYSSTSGLGLELSPKEKDEWFEHNIYWSLYTSDKYVWCYSEHMDWWKNQTLPGNSRQMVFSAREMFEKNTPPLNDFTEKVTKIRESFLGRAKPNNTEIHRLPKDTPAPKLDGVLDDPAWAAMEELPFALLAYYSTDPTPKASTVARATYDEKNLYLSFDCKEPNMAGLKLLAKAHEESQIYEKDNIVFFLIAENSSGKPVKQFILNPDGFHWDAEYVPNGALHQKDFNPEYQLVAKKNADGWVLEAAFPWAAFGIDMPEPGTVLRGNFCRQRDVDGNELSAWSVTWRHFMEPEYYGFLKFVE